MRPDQIRGLAGSLMWPVLGIENVEDIVVREEDDGAGERSLFVDVFVAPGTLPVGAETYLRLRRSLSEELDAMGEPRFAHLRLRDKRGEREIGGASGEA